MNFFFDIKTNYKHTIIACYLGYINQALANNFAPLLFIFFNKNFNIPLNQLSLLVTINFCVQILVDFLSAKFVDKIGYRICAVGAGVLSALGFFSLAILPFIMPNNFFAICISIVLYAIGGGLEEVLISPILEACPTKNKEASMSLLHSFYCWGSVAVVLISTLAFYLFGIQNWYKIALFWTIIPVITSIYFCFVPIQTLVSEDEKMSFSSLFSSKIFWILIILMICSGASEQAMSQWASAFAESGLKVSKTIGDIAGPCFFSILMGFSRILHSKLANKIDIYKYLTSCCFLCIASYCLAVFSPLPILSLLGCGICGFSVGAMWPASFSLAAKKCSKGGTSLFAFLALAGDIGCAGGPTQVGFISSKFNDNLKIGLISALFFPLLMIIVLTILKKQKNE